MDSPVEEIFALALEKEGGDRETFLAEACGDDAELRLEVQRMLVDAERAEVLYGNDRGDDDELLSSALTNDLAMEQAGDQLGPYLLEEQLGEGGYGVVWKAKQQKPIARHVALKIVKAGMDSRQVLIRFEAERQALALMDHPNIAKIFDAGTTEQGRPYFAMELVWGSRITDYCEEKKVGTEGRLRLVLQACHAIQHAHQKGVVHRDIKPSNVLVSEIEGRPEVKVIDFGIAKAMGISLTERTLMTGTVEMMGTLEYMSPEQFAIDSRQVDSRTDVYSLGVLLFKLLTGGLPHKFGDKTIYSVARMVVEEPARRLGGTSGVFRGDLDTIVGKALQKEPELRYASASELAADLQRFLDREPITARRAGTLYQLKLFTRRNKALVGGVVATIAALSVGIVLSLIAFGEARRERQAAEEQVYRSALMAASRSYQTGDRQEGRAHLERVPDRLRDWIWNLLAAQAEEPRFEFRARDVVFVDDRTIRTVTRRGIEDWDVPSGTRQRFTPFDREQPTIGTRFTPDGALALAISQLGDDPYLYRVLDATSGDTIDSFSATNVKASLWGKTMLALGNRRVAYRDTWISIRVRDLRTGEEFSPIKLEAAAQALSPDENVLAVTSKWKGLLLYDVRTGEPLEGVDPIDYRPWFAAFHPNGETFVTIEGDQDAPEFSGIPEVRTWKTANGEPVDQPFLRLPGKTRRFVASPEGSRLAIPVEQTVVMVDTERHEIVRTLSGWPDRVRIVAFAPDGESIAALDQMGSDAGGKTTDESNGMVWSSRDPNVLEGHRGGINCVAFSPDGQRIASGGADGLVGAGGCIRIWDASTGAAVATWGAPWIVLSLQFTRDGSKLVATGKEPGAAKRGAGTSIRIWSAETGRLLSEIAEPLRGGSLSPDETTMAGALFVEQLHGFLALVDLETGERRDGPPCQMLYNNSSPVFSPDGTKIVSTGPDHSVAISDADSLRPLTECVGHSDEVTSIVFREGARQILTASTDDTIRLWSVETGEQLAILRGPHSDVFCAVFAHDDAHVLSGSRDGKIRIWSLGDRQIVAELAGHRKFVYSLMLSPDGRTIASGSGDSTVRLWGTEPRSKRWEAIAGREQLVNELRPHVLRLFDELPDPTAVVANLRTEFEGRRLEVGLQITLGEAVVRVEAAPIEAQ